MWRSIPWYMRFYLVVLGTITLLLIISAGFAEFRPGGVADKLLAIFSDSFKTAFGAVLGALGAVAGATSSGVSSSSGADRKS
jgi:hypothetical protein